LLVHIFQDRAQGLFQFDTQECDPGTCFPMLGSLALQDMVDGSVDDKVEPLQVENGGQKHVENLAECSVVEAADRPFQAL
jgi:hypothetical protein